MSKRIVMAVVGFVLLGMVAAAGCKSKSAGMTLAEFKKIAKPGCHIAKGELLSKLGQPEKLQIINRKTYLYYKVQEGTVQMRVHVMDLPYEWETAKDSDTIGIGKVNLL